MTHAIEITTLRLKAGLSIADFITANADIDPWIRRQPGFMGRRICERDDGMIVDIVFWETTEDGHRSAAGIMTEMAESPVHLTIDHRSVDWTISQVHHSLDG
ncbi:hypothetical protein OHD62_23435 [Mesorhizobium sp. YC-39]|uniref:hypothetical protein n=1 Tax=unclassified Mesorhizobium TaxID=325217 RepID=UPI0021E70798|nr:MULTISPECIES: hypothetical protein [unclassified Mesorhizobium]MCV3209312.1 hypothetical protein [Mesorhizobium sp. YC-2]MCV3231338.1 hypothetical protein [Mesorhizobium sp. YC-39]